MPAGDRQLRHPRGRLRRGRRVIVLGIDPGTAALGYGIVERTGGPAPRGRPRLPDDEPGPVAARAAARDPRAGRRAARAPPAGPARGRAAVLLAQRPDRVRRRPGARRRAAGRGPARDAGPRGDPERGQERDRGLRRGRQGAGPADGPARPRDERAAAARRRRRRAGHRDLGRQHASGPGPTATAGVLDRAAVAPITRGETGYERAVREALAAETAADARRQAQRVLARAR